MDPVRVGVVGCGAISAAYFKMAAQLPHLQMAACADLDREKAQARAEEFAVPRVLEVDELLRDPGIEVVLNLTVPKAHLPIALAALEHGKHTFAEKPLGVNREEGRRILDAAAAAGLRVGCAPDTFMGAGIQTARKVIDDGLIGKPVAFTAFMMCRGHEHWHPSPEFYYEVGGGPMFDMGPYYLTALLNLLGPIRRLFGMATIAIPERTITSQPKHGKKVAVETPDHLCGLVEFEQGAAGTIVTSFAVRQPVYDGKLPITIYGTEGALKVPDPNTFDGVPQLRREGEADWTHVPHSFVTGYGRAIGLADMARAIRTGRPHRCSGEQAFAVLDAMQGFLDSSESGCQVTASLAYRRPAPMPSLPFGELD
jgi:predicted dehydrogenase